MPLHTANLFMVGIGIVGDNPPNSEQPPLIDAVHLRWAFDRQIGFPWHGFYLFRREHRPGTPVCLSSVTGHLQKGLWPSRGMFTLVGEISSDRDIALTDLFDPTGLVEFDLDGQEDGRTYLRYSFPQGKPVRGVKARIGFRGNLGEPSPARECVNFEGHPMGFEQNPLSRQGVTFNVKDGNGRPLERARFGIWETDPERFTPNPIALVFGRELEITLPGLSSFVEVTLMHRDSPPVVEAFNDDGTSAGWQGMLSPTEPETLRITGHAINRVVIIAPRERTYLLDFCFGTLTGSRAEIKVTAFSGDVAVATKTVKGFGGQIISVPLEVDYISAIEFGRGPAVLIDMCFVPVEDEANIGWQEITSRRLGDFQYPMCLPVAHSDYPCQGAPQTPARAEALALSRIVDSSGAGRAGILFTELHDELVELVVEGPAGQPMAERYRIDTQGAPDPPDDSVDPPVMPLQSPLDNVLISALDPAFAQMLGLYWADDTAEFGKAYDYLIVADYLGLFDPFIGGTARRVSMRMEDFDNVEGYIVFNLKKAPAPPVLAPGDVRAYSLPTPTQSMQLKDATNIAGLRWELGLDNNGILQPGMPIMYHVWRDSLGNSDNPAAPDNYELITRNQPVVITTTESEDDDLFGPFTRAGVFIDAGPVAPFKRVEVERSRDWPPFRLHFMDRGYNGEFTDRGLAEGWYSYQVNGQDIFGRHSPNSPAARWFQWVPRPNPVPWYYQDPPSDSPIHPFAIRLLDKTPPPPPTAIEAYALDPADPALVRDEAYLRWYQELSGPEKRDLIGLRVRWQWTDFHASQAPDTREFRIYYRGEQMNALFGRSLSVEPQGSSNMSLVRTNIPNTLAANAYAGLWIQIGEDGFPIVSSQSGNTLTLTVKDIGPVATGARVRPRANEPCSIAIPQGHSLFKDYSIATEWSERLHVVGYNERVRLGVTPLKAASGEDLVGTKARVTGSIPPPDGLPDPFTLDPITGGRQFNSIVSLDSAADLSLLQELVVELHFKDLYLYLAGDSSFDKVYRIISVDNTAKRVTVTGTPNVGLVFSPWAVGQLVRKYEVFLPDPDSSFHQGLPLTTSSEQPVDYAHIAVSAADDKTHTGDSPRWAAGRWGNRFGNEGPVGAPATIFRVHREKPDEPSMPPIINDRDQATRADYYGRSFYTFRWLPSGNLRAHIFRALDDTVFQIDWLIRTTRGSLNARLPQHQVYFPEETAGVAWSLARKQAAADKLNALNSVNSAGAYAQLSSLENAEDVKALLARLPGNEGFAWDQGLQERDWLIRSSRKDFAASVNPRWTSIIPGLMATVERDVVRLDGTHDLTQVRPYRDTIWLEQSGPDSTARSRRRFTITAVDASTRTITLDESVVASAITTAWAIHLDEYSELSDGALRILAGLPGNEAAYTQITVEPLAAGVSSYKDTLDGRSTNRYFYRAAFVDAAYNQSALGPPGPPVYLPDVVPPRAPVITKLLGGDGEITLKWAPNQEPDLAGYHVYRTDSPNAVRDLRLMVLMHIEPERREPFARRADIEWTDKAVIGGSTYFYRVIAVDKDDNASAPSDMRVFRAVDTRIPDPPDWLESKWVVLSADGSEQPWPSDGIIPVNRRVAIRLVWSSTVIKATMIVLRLPLEGTTWRSIAVEGDYREIASMKFLFYDTDVSPDKAYAYRIRVISPSGVSSLAFRNILVEPPS